MSVSSLELISSEPVGTFDLSKGQTYQTHQKKMCDAHEMFGYIVLCLIIHLFYFGHAFIPVNILYGLEEQPRHLTWDKISTINA